MRERTTCGRNVCALCAGETHAANRVRFAIDTHVVARADAMRAEQKLQFFKNRRQILQL